MRSLVIAVARLLWAYEIEADGEQEIDPYAMTQGFNSRPQPFKALFRVRDDETRKVICSEWNSTEKDLDVLLDEVQCRRGTLVG